MSVESSTCLRALHPCDPGVPGTPGTPWHAYADVFRFFVRRRTREDLFLCPHPAPAFEAGRTETPRHWWGSLNRRPSYCSRGFLAGGSPSYLPVLTHSTFDPPRRHVSHAPPARCDNPPVRPPPPRLSSLVLVVRRRSRRRPPPLKQQAGRAGLPEWQGFISPPRLRTVLRHHRRRWRDDVPLTDPASAERVMSQGLDGDALIWKG